MKTLLFITSLVLLPFLSRAHDYFFAFAEMEYNVVTERVELTVTVTTHDFELALEEQGTKIDNIISLTEKEIETVQTYMNKHVQLISGFESTLFKYMGNEVSLDGTSNWYFESEPIAFQEEISIRFDLLMDVFPEQQNKVTLYHKDKTFTAAFTPIDKTKQIYIEN
ncbi:MAG: DUF6702 family protein [Fluviicola sp.]